MNTEFISEWTAELRSGEVEQGKHRLATIDDGKVKFCCLGVAENLLVKKGLQTCTTAEDRDHDFMMFGAEEEAGVLSQFGVEYLGFDMPNPDIELEDFEDPEGKGLSFSLAELNDEGFTFVQIADLIDYFFGGEN